MRNTLSALVLAMGMAFGATAQAHDMHINNGSCGYKTDYDVRVDSTGIYFDRTTAAPNHVFMHDGQLKVEGRAIQVSAADADRLRTYEKGVRDLMPEVASIAREGVDIGFTAMRAITTTFAQDESQRRRLMVRLEDNRARALTQIDNTIGKGVWKKDSFDEDFGDSVGDTVGDAVSELVSSITEGAVKAALTGDQSKVAALEARANSLDATIKKEVDSRAHKLDARAEALCPRLQAMDQLQQQFQFRLADGSRLQLMTYDKDSDDNRTKDGKRPNVASR